MNRFYVRQCGPHYFEIRDAITGTHRGVKVGQGAREAAEAEADRLNRQDRAQDLAAEVK